MGRLLCPGAVIFPLRYKYHIRIESIAPQRLAFPWYIQYYMSQSYVYITIIELAELNSHTIQTPANLVDYKNFIWCLSGAYLRI